MKKFKSLIATLLSVSVIASGAALTACHNDGEGGGNIKPIDEQTWKAAFDELDYSNVTMHYYDEQIDEIGIVMLSENAVYYKLRIGYRYLDELYSIKNEDGTYTNYIKMCHSENDNYNIEDEKFALGTSSGWGNDWIFKRAKEALIFTADYESSYNAFQYDENAQTYAYNGVIEAEQIDFEDFGDYIYDDVETYHFVDNIVKVSNNKIVSYSFKINWYSCVCKCTNDEHNEAGKEVDCSVEYYDIGSTLVTVPQEVIDEAMANPRKY